MRSFFLAMQFLTVLPVTKNHDAAPSDFQRSLLWFPVIGAFIGAVQWGAALLLLQASVPVDLAAPLVVAIAIIVTGGLHIDGVADCADGFGAGRDRASILRIMKDGRLGVFAVIAVVLLLYVKIIAVTYILKSGERMILLFAPAISRATLAGTCTLLPYARESGAGKFFAGGSFWKHAFPALTVTTLFIALYGNLAVLAGGLAAWAILCAYYYSRIAGYTGDTLGLQNEVVELAALISAVHNE